MKQETAAVLRAAGSVLRKRLNALAPQQQRVEYQAPRVENIVPVPGVTNEITVPPATVNVPPPDFLALVQAIESQTAAATAQTASMLLAMQEQASTALSAMREQASAAQAALKAHTDALLEAVELLRQAVVILADAKPPEVKIRNILPEQPAPQVSVEAPQPGPASVEFQRDRDGQIVSAKVTRS